MGFFNGEKEEAETSDFASKGTAPFPPTYHDNLDVRNFSDKSKYTSRILGHKLGEYMDFIAREDPMPRAKKIGRRIIDHLIFELTYRENEVEDCPTVPINIYDDGTAA